MCLNSEKNDVKSKFIRLGLLLASVLHLTACSFSGLKADLQSLEEVTHTFDGSVVADELASDAIVIVATKDPEGASVTGFMLLHGAGSFTMRLSPSPTFFFAFNDLNKDLRFQRDEPFGWAQDGTAVDAGDGATSNVAINISASSAANRQIPQQLIDVPLDQHLSEHVQFNVGAVTTLDNVLFSEDQAQKGLWEPYAFMQDGGTGIHFLQPYDPEKIPVLFVHGILGSPRNFTALIDQLDTSHYQAWVYSYPSGLNLAWLARGMDNFLGVLHLKYGFEELHVVAHSMGGLVSRGSLNRCTSNSSCSYLRSFTTISTPWDGVESAESGVKWAPTVVPVWRDLVPTSEYVSTLFDTPLPDNLPHHLIFGFRQDSIFGSESSDGIIKLSSQLREQAQNQATVLHGYDEDHVSILSNQNVMTRMNEILGK
jgi:uncharacterized alpha/beta hydrolase family protein